MASPKPVDSNPSEEPARWSSPRPFATDDERYARQQNQNGGDTASQGDKEDHERGEKLVKPNKVYIGGLPDHTRREDLQSCFGKIGNIVNIELKLGYGFVEFDTREAAEESVAKYHEGYFMGQKIKVELSRGGGRTAKYTTDPGACFKCGEQGHWARECPNYQRRSGDPPLVDRISREHAPREYPPPREDYGRYPPPPPARDPRYGGGYEYPPPPGRRPPSPREYRDYPPSARGPPPREYYDERMRGPPGPPPPPPVPPPARYDARPGPPGSYYGGDSPPPAGYPPRGYGPPPPTRDPYDRFDRGGPPPPPRDRFGSYPPAGGRPRTPPGIPPRGRDDFERGPPRDFARPPPVGRLSPPRYGQYPPPRGGGPEPPRYRRRSQSPPARGGPGFHELAPPYPPSNGDYVPNPYGNGPPGGAIPRDYQYRRP